MYPFINHNQNDVISKMFWKNLHTLFYTLAEKDCLFPGEGVIERAERIIPNCQTYLLKDRGHMNVLTDNEKKLITDFLLRNSN